VDNTNLFCNSKKLDIFSSNSFVFEPNPSQPISNVSLTCVIASLSKSGKKTGMLLI
jgi:hypothetical protein